MKTLFISHVFSSNNNLKYYEYIPSFIYGVLETQENAFVKILIDRKLPKKIKKALDLIDNRNFEIVENFKIDIECSLISKPQLMKSIRWLLGSSYFKGFDYAYIGDVDFIMYDDKITELHLANCEKLGLPYSNSIRPNGKQMAGLHFIKCEEYFKTIDKTINYILKDNKIDKFMGRITAEDKRNEHFLYELIKNCIGFNDLETEITHGNRMCFRPHHGIHLGVLRSKEMKLVRIPKYVNDKIFKEIQLIIKNKEIQKVINYEIHYK